MLLGFRHGCGLRVTFWTWSVGACWPEEKRLL
jgi:hypothetical protein